MGFTSCHNHSMYSNLRLRDALGKVPEMIEYAHSLGYRGIAFTEHECISSALEANKYYYAHKNLPEWKGFKVILGNEIYLCPPTVQADNPEKNIFPHFILLAKDALGHQQIRELSTRAWSHAFFSTMMRVPTYYSDLEEIIGNNPGHVIGSTACLGGSLPRRLLQCIEHPEYYQSCIDWCKYMVNIFGKGNFFLEMQPGISEEQILCNEMLVKLEKDANNAILEQKKGKNSLFQKCTSQECRKYGVSSLENGNETVVSSDDNFGVKLIVTTDTHYLKKEDKEVHHIFLNASQDGDRETDGFYDSTYMMSVEEIHENMDDYLGTDLVQRVIDNTDKIYDMIEDYDLTKSLRIPYMPLDNTEPDKGLYEKWVKYIPLFEYFYHSDFSGDRHMTRELLKFIECHKSYQNSKHYKAVEECLNYIKLSSEKMNTHWSAYLMQIRDYVGIAWDKGTLVGAGRGSGVGFCLLYMLDITQIDPLRENTPTYPWRFLNPYRASVLDIDNDIMSSKREDVMQGFREVYGEDRVSKVCTFSTEGTRSAILSSARGLGIDNDEAQYIASLVVADRGLSRTLKQMYYGDEENDYKPVTEFVNEMNLHPELWDAAQKIEGVINGCGSHSGGVIFVDEPFTNTTALMKTNSGDVVTQFDLHQCEDVSLIKIDLLSIAALDKEYAELMLLLKDGVIEWEGSLKATYEKCIGIYTLERNDPKMWDCLLQHKVLSFFQMEKESGHKAISIGQPQSVDDLAALNAVMRLMAQEKGGESPLEKYGRFRNDIKLWYKEMEDAGLTKEEQELLKPIVGNSYGICQAQEQMMMLVQIPEVGGFDLVWADKLRKAVAKKNPKAFVELEEEFFQNATDKKLSKNLTKYVWNVLVNTQRGYGFNAAHTLSYSLIGLQELNLYYKYDPIYWVCANLIVDSGSADEEGENKSTNYGKVAIAINEVKDTGVEIVDPAINEAEFGYKPDIANQRIITSLKSICGIGDEVAQLIISNRPYDSYEDFCKRMIETKLVKPAQMIALIKAGCFLILHNKDKRETMKSFFEKYIFSKCEKLSMQQINKIIELNMIPDSLIICMKILSFKNYVLSENNVVQNVINEGKKLPKCGYHDRIFVLDDRSQVFFKNVFSENSVCGISKNHYLISEKNFNKEVAQKLEPLKEWFDKPNTLIQYNDLSLKSIMNDKAPGTVNKWSMDALGYYDVEHELANINEKEYGCVNFFAQPEQPEIYDTYTKWINGERRIFPKKTICRIMGTVVSSDNNHNMISLLTLYGVVNVKFNKGQYTFYNKRISQPDPNEPDKKKVLENSWFKRGNILLVAGYREESLFKAYRYNETVFTHTVSLVVNFTENNQLELQNERVKV